MKKLFTQALKKWGTMASILLVLTTQAQAIVYEPGQVITKFYEDDEFYVYSSPSLSTDDSLLNWSFYQFDENHMISSDDHRGWRAIFEVNAPAAGTYGIEVLVRSTTTNWQVGFSSTQELLTPWKSADKAPAWESLARPVNLSTVWYDEGALCDHPLSGEWETIYAPVELAEGHNFVVLWLCRVMRGWDWLNGPDGSTNGFYVKSLKVMPQESAPIATLLQKASQRLWQLTNFPVLNTEATASFAADYDLLKTSMDEANTQKLIADMAAADAAEQELRHGRGIMVDRHATFALPFYHDLKGGEVAQNERGDYGDAPVVFEYTNGKTLVYKFTTTTDGTYYPEILAASEANCNFYMNILAADSTTKVMEEWIQRVNTEAWQSYNKFSRSTLYNFEAQAGQTYYLTLYMENFVNVRSLSMHKYLKGEKTYEELDALWTLAEEYYMRFEPGTMGYYSIGCDDELLERLLTLIDNVMELDENCSVEEITELYYQIEAILSKLDEAKLVNMIPNDEEFEFDLTNGTLDQWQIENGSNIGYGYQNGSACYPIYNRRDAKYDINLLFSNATGDVSTMSAYVDVVTEEGSTIRVAEVDQAMNGTGGWGNQEPRKFTGIAIPEGMVTVTFYGKQAASNGFCGNIYHIDFTPIEGTDGEGKKALDEARSTYETAYSPERLQQLITRANEEVVNYGFPEYDQTYVEQVKAALADAEEALASGNIDRRAKAYQALEAALDKLPESMSIVWLSIPSSENNPFFIEAGLLNQWQFMYEENKIGMVVADGNVTFYAEVEEEGTYDMTIETANPGEGGQFHVIVTPIDSETPAFDGLIDVPNTGAWDARDFIHTTMALPAGRLKLFIQGETAASSGYVGDIYSIKFEKSESDGINATKFVGNSIANQLYDLAGRRITKPVNGQMRKGLYITNGKKLLVK